MFKVLHVNYSDIKGGAAIATMRLHNALKNHGIDSTMLVSEKIGNDNSVIGPSSTFEILVNQFKVSLSRYVKRKLIKTKNKETFSFNLLNTNLLKKINDFDVDIVNLHWIGYEMISISQLKKINKPVVWTFHDMWPMCGAEHYSDDERYLVGYSKENRPAAEKGIDLNRHIWNYKKKKLDFNYTIITPSKWLFNKVKNSKLHEKKNIYHIPWSIDCSVWKPLNHDDAKTHLNIPKNKINLIFGSATATNKRKGFDFLLELFKKKKFDNYRLLIFGERPSNIEQLNIEHKYLGKINDVHSLKLLYSASNLLLMPSKIEIFGLIGLEASACGIPSVIFESTGATDFIKHKENGYVAKNLDLEDFQNGIFWCVENDKRYKTLSENSIKNVNEKFEDNMVVKNYINVYKNLSK